MMSRKMMLCGVLSVFLLVSVASLTGASDQGGLSSDVSLAEKAIEEERYGDAVGLMEKHVEARQEKAQGAQVRYLLALALFHRTRLDINECRERGEIGSRLKTEQADEMKRAERYFLESQEMDPDGPRADACLYFAGVIQDYGCLNHFEDAKDTFNKLVDLYPESEYAEEARFRADRLGGHGGVPKRGFH